jgi:hypothetical protein
MRDQVRGDRNELGVRRTGECSHAVTRFEVCDSGSCLAHHATNVAPEDDGKLQGKVLLPRPGADLPINRIDAGGNLFYQD